MQQHIVGCFNEDIHVVKWYWLTKINNIISTTNCQNFEKLENNLFLPSFKMQFFKRMT